MSLEKKVKKMDKQRVATQEFRIRFGTKSLIRILHDVGMEAEAKELEKIYDRWDTFFNSIRKEVFNRVSQK